MRRFEEEHGSVQTSLAPLSALAGVIQVDPIEVVC